MSDVLFGALIGAGGVLAANALQLLSSWNKSKKADADWRRDQRRDAYADLLQAADDYRKSASDLHRAARPQVDLVFGDHLVKAFEDKALQLEEKGHLLDRAASRVTLLGSRRVQAPVNILALHALRTMSDGAEADPRMPEEAWQTILGQYFEAFLNAAREDLGFESLPPPPT